MTASRESSSSDEPRVVEAAGDLEELAHAARNALFTISATLDALAVEPDLARGYREAEPELRTQIARLERLLTRLPARPGPPA